MNIYEISKKANVSTATVSRYINQSGYVGKETAKKLAEIIEKEKYVPSVFAKNLSNGKTSKLIGVVCFDISDLYYAKSVSILEKMLRAIGYDIIVSCTLVDIANKEQCVSALLNKGVEAIVFIGAVFLDDNNQTIKQTAKQVPCFMINAFIDSDNIFCVFSDDKKAVKDITAQLSKENNSTLLYLANSQSFGNKIKIEGFKQGCKNGDIVMLNDDFDYIIQNVKQLFANKKYTAVICCNDLIASATLLALKQININVPHEVRVIGHNNSILTLTSTPQLSTINNQVEELSIQTAKNIEKYFNNTPVKKSQIVDYEIIIRGT